jgi:ABC-type transport system involved in multi-copper enzyme maturation permease subunit
VAHVGLLVLRLAVVIAIAIAFSTVVSPTVALIASLGLTIAGYFTSDLRFFLGKSEDPMLQAIGNALYYCAPDFSLLDSLPRLLHGHPVADGQTLLAAVYAIAYAALALALGWFAFSKRDLG